MKILLAEDDFVTRKFMTGFLSKYGECDVTVDGMEAVDAFMMALEEGEPYDLVCLDIMMPVMDGVTMLMKLRAMNYEFPVIMLSAKSEEVDKIMGLNMGADDYVTKPFSPSELMARVDALYRRVELGTGTLKNDDEDNTIVSGEFVLNIRNRTLTKNDKPIELTQMEFQIMEYFFMNQGAALSRTAILEKVWGDNYYGEEKIVDVNIRRLRMKVEDDPSSPKHLLTLWGIGYKWIA